jgi:hypothetical protein
VDASAYAFAHGVRRTRATFERWQDAPGSILRPWLAGAFLAAVGLLLAVWVIGSLNHTSGLVELDRPPFRTGGPVDTSRILLHNGLVLALHAMACVAGFIAGSSLPLQASAQRSRILRAVHAHGGRLAILFVAAATTFSLSVQALVLGQAVGRVSFALHTSPGLLLLALLPHALPELMALFLPLAAWILASRAGRWEELLAATAVTVAIALPALVLSSLWETYAAPHVLRAILG